jgi:hypothetical protein
MDSESFTLNPQKFAFAAALAVCVLLWVGLTSAQTVSGSTGQVPAVNDSPQTGLPAASPPLLDTPALGSAYLDLNLLAEVNSIDEADNARWSLVRGTSAESEVYSSVSGVDWGTLRQINATGRFRVTAGITWSFNAAFADGHGYKIASGVLAGGHCALATVFRAAAINAGLLTGAKPHRYPIPGFPLNQTVNIWWGRDDLTITNTTAQDLDLAWTLSPGGIEISVIPSQ